MLPFEPGCAGDRTKEIHMRREVYIALLDEIQNNFECYDVDHRRRSMTTTRLLPYELHGVDRPAAIRDTAGC